MKSEEKYIKKTSEELREIGLKDSQILELLNEELSNGGRNMGQRFFGLQTDIEAAMENVRNEGYQRQRAYEEIRRVLQKSYEARIAAVSAMSEGRSVL